jgi:hypothetical protein
MPSHWTFSLVTRLLTATSTVACLLVDWCGLEE